ncbi:uncharacterized protein LOC142660514 [Rhinoderma darwinii]|uniref:uncharacterized protein LOC142660514 n=1 Tax=Rhinoderma darwinii TaxID=43563 RepID=UPI003F66704B
MKSIADRQKLYQDYISHYESRSHEGNVTLCDQMLQCRGDTQLCDSPAALGGFYSLLITQNLQRKKEERRVEVLKQMMKGFAILELICVNLFLFPWRREIRTLKKFTGNFVYFVEPVIPEDIIRQILQRVGYSIASDTEYAIQGKINPEEAKQTAFELYLSRIQCEKLLRLKNEDKSLCVNLLVNGPSFEEHNGDDHTGQAGKSTNRADGVHEIEGVNNFDLKSNVTSPDTTKAVNLTVTPRISPDVLSDTSKKEPNYYIKPLDSVEFLNDYNDLNLAQQPIFPLHNIKNKEPNFAKPHIPSESTIPKGSDLAEKVICGLQSGDNIDVRTFNEKLDPPKSLMLNESYSEVHKRLVIKLKMPSMAGESLAYPIEETNSEKFSNSNGLGKKEVKWELLKTKEGTEIFTGHMSLSSDFSVLSNPNKSAIGTPENKLREPPNSTYIPPRAPESECMRLTNIKPEENHFRAASLPGDTLLVNEFNVQEDIKEGYVMITRNNPLKN